MIDYETQEFIRAELRKLVRWTTMVNPSSDGGDQVKPLQGTPTAAKDQATWPRYQQYGFRSSPPPGAKLIGLAVSGSECQRVQLASEMPGAGPQSQPSGEVELYGPNGQRLYLPSTGDVVVLPGDTGKVALGDAAATEQAVKGTQFFVDFGTWIASLDTMTIALQAAMNKLSGEGALSMATQTECAAAAADAGAVATDTSTFLGALPGDLSPNVVVKS